MQRRQRIHISYKRKMGKNHKKYIFFYRREGEGAVGIIQI